MIFDWKLYFLSKFSSANFCIIYPLLPDYQKCFSPKWQRQGITAFKYGYYILCWKIAQETL